MVVRQLRSAGVRIVALEHADESKPYTSIGKDAFPLCLIVGNEISGIGKELLAESDCAIDIPMYGMKQSLNAAVAFGIAVFELVRRYKSGG